VSNHGVTIRNSIKLCDNLQLTVCYDVYPHESEKVREEFGCRIANDYSDLVSDGQVEAVVLITPNYLHPLQTRIALEHGKHVFVEKPIANTIREAKEIVSLGIEKGVIFQVGHNTRKKRTFRRAKEIVEKNRLSKLVAVEANMSFPTGIRQVLPQWKFDKKTCPLLPMMQLGIHFIDTLQYLISPIKRVSCFQTRRAMAGNVSDATSSLLEFESGVIGTLSSHYVIPDIYQVKIFGTRGILTCYSESMTLEAYSMQWEKTVEHEDYSDEGAESYYLEMKEFGDCVLKGVQPETSGEVGLRALAVVEAMLLSAEEGRAVEVADLV
jgi:UDP-N-acetylglucosamine 3-dehydrogenase